MRTLKPRRVNLRNAFGTLDAFIYLYLHKIHSYVIIISTSIKSDVRIVISSKKLKQSLKYQNFRNSSLSHVFCHLRRILSIISKWPTWVVTYYTSIARLPWCIFESLTDPTSQSSAQKLFFKFKKMETFLKDSGFDSVGEFLKILFYNCLDCLEAYEILPAVPRSHSFLTHNWFQTFK